MTDKRTEGLGLALGGGGMKGLAHIGALEIIEEAGLYPDMVAGTSIGAIVGALYASGMELAEMKVKGHRMELISNPLAVSLDAIDMASHRLEPEEALEFFADLLNEAEHFPVKQRLRQRLVELNFELDRPKEAKKYLRQLINPSGD